MRLGSQTVADTVAGAALRLQGRRILAHPPRSYVNSASLHPREQSCLVVRTALFCHLELHTWLLLGAVAAAPIEGE